MNQFQHNRAAVDENETQKKLVLDIKSGLTNAEMQPPRGLAERQTNIPVSRFNEGPKGKQHRGLRFGGGNCLISPDEADDIDRYMRHIEMVNKIPANFLRNHKTVNARMRQILVDWLFHVQLRFNMLDETLSLAVHVLDRSLLVLPNINKNNLQLLGLANLFVASKFEEVEVPFIDDFIHVAANVFTKEDILTMEDKVLRACNFDLGHPHSIHYLRRYRFYVAPQDHVYQFAKYITQVAMIAYPLAHHPPSLVAAVALWLASYTFGRALLSDKLFTDVFKHDKDSVVNTASSFVDYVIKFADPNESSHALRSKHEKAFEALTEPHIARMREFSDDGFSFATKPES